MPEVSAKVSEILQGIRKAILQVWNRLHEHLNDRVHQHRKDRDSDDADLFNYIHSLYANRRWNHLRFAVNDTIAQDHLFVEAVSFG